MGWFSWFSRKPQGPDSAEIAKVKRCRQFVSGLEGCRKANPGDQATSICKHMEMKLVTCLAEQHAVPEADEHRRCYTKLYKTGQYKGLGHCKPYEEAMKTALRKKNLYPV